MTTVLGILGAAGIAPAALAGDPLPTEGTDPVANVRVIDAVHAAAGMRG